MYLGKNSAHQCLDKNDDLFTINSEKIDSVINIDSDKDIISRRRLKEIEEYYTSQYLDLQVLNKKSDFL